MKVEGLPLDMVNKLPPNIIIQTMLTLMPMRDAFRTSILARNWRDHCLTIPKLNFDDELFKGPSYKNLSIKCKLLHVIYPILLLHQGPILEFSLSISQLSSCREIDQFIRHLSGHNAIMSFTLCIEIGDNHNLLSSFFTLKQLMILKLQKCAFQPPVSFKGFSRLISLYFHGVSLTLKVLLRFLINCPLLKDFTLVGDEKYFIGCWNSNFAELFECLPLIEYLHMSSYPAKCFATGVIPQRYPNSLVHLKHLRLSGLCFARELELRSAVLLVTSSPNLERVIMEMNHNPTEAVSQSAMDFFGLQDYSCVFLSHLPEIKITNFTNMKPGMDFLKLILAKSPTLKLIDVVIDKRVDSYSEIKMLRELLQYERASSRAKIIVRYL